MALEGLDKVPWHKLSTSYGRATDAPKYLRMLLSPNETDREKAYEYIIGTVNHQSDLHDSTAAIVPFLLQLLSDAATPEREKILITLYAYLDSMDTHFDQVKDVEQFSLFNSLYHKLKQGVPIYETFLTHPEVRLEAAWMIGKLANKQGRTRLRLVKAFEQRGYDYALFEALIVSLPGEWNPDRRIIQAYQCWFEALLKSDSVHAKGIGAAGWLHCHTRMEPFSSDFDAIPPAIFEAIFAAIAQLPVYLDDLMPYILDLSVEFLVKLFPTTDLQPHRLHQIARKMLTYFQPVYSFPKNHAQNLYTIRSRDEVIWDAFLDGITSYADATELMYRFEPDPKWIERNRQLNTDQQRQVLKAIVEKEAFWELPTNIFSFLYGLPDEREALRQLVHEAEQRAALRKLTSL